MPSTILSDNGVSSGSAGLKSTASNDGVLILQTTTSGGTATNAIYVDTSQRVGIKDATIGANALSLRAIGNSYSNGALALQDAAGTSKNYITAIAGTVYVGDNSSNDCATVNQYGVGLGGNAATSGLGIRFPATQSASSDANTLDDYEEGTWTPTFGAGSGSFTTLTYNIQYGRYTKIGNMVYFIAALQVNTVSVGTAASYLYVGGLPFTSGSYAYNESPAVVGECAAWSTQRPTTSYVDNNSTNAILEYATSTAATLILPSYLTTSTYMQISGFYSVT